MAGFKRGLIGLLAGGMSGLLWGAAPAIGVATAKGPFDINKTRVTGAVTLYDGAVVETGAAGSRLDFSNGSRLDVSANSSVTVRAGEAVLEKGSAELGFGSGFRLNARSLRIETEGASGRADVRLSGDREVLVQAVNGEVRVLSKTGVLVARVAPGTGVTLDPYSADPAAFDMTGCLLKQDHGQAYGFSADDLRFEVAGSDLDRYVGSRVRLSGTRSDGTPVLKSSSAVVQVAKIEAVGGGACKAAAAAWPSPDKMTGSPASGVRPPKASAGVHAHTTAIIGGVAVAGAGGGIAAAVCCKSK